MTSCRLETVDHIPQQYLRWMIAENLPPLFKEAQMYQLFIMAIFII